MENKKIIEINGVKLEIDLRNAKVIENYRVGDNVKVLIKEYDKFAPYIGQIIGFDNFQEHPTIIIAYLRTGYKEASINFVYFNKESKDLEITNLNEWDVPVTKSDVIRWMNQEIEANEQKTNELKNKKEVFLKLFGKYFDKEEKDKSEEI